MRWSTPNGQDAEENHPSPPMRPMQAVRPMSASPAGDNQALDQQDGAQTQVT